MRRVTHRRATCAGRPVRDRARSLAEARGVGKVRAGPASAFVMLPLGRLCRRWIECPRRLHKMSGHVSLWCGGRIEGRHRHCRDVERTHGKALGKGFDCPEPDRIPVFVDRLEGKFYTGTPPRQRQTIEQYKIVKRVRGRSPSITGLIPRRSRSGGAGTARPMFVPVQRRLIRR